MLTSSPIILESKSLNPYSNGMKIEFDSESIKAAADES